MEHEITKEELEEFLANNSTNIATKAISDALKKFGMIVHRVAIIHSPTQGVEPHFKITGIIPAEDDINAWG